MLAYRSFWGYDLVLACQLHIANPNAKLIEKKEKKPDAEMPFLKFMIIQTLSLKNVVYMSEINSDIFTWSEDLCTLLDKFQYKFISKDWRRRKEKYVSRNFKLTGITFI